LNKTILDWETKTDSFGNDLGSQQNVSEKVYAIVQYYDSHLVNICNNLRPKIRHSGNIHQELHSVLFEGGLGSGKTFLASVLVQSAIRKGLTAKYYEWTDLSQTISDYSKKDQTDLIAEEFKILDFIVVDGIENYNSFNNVFIVNLERIIKGRLNSGKPILLFSLGNTNSISSASGWSSLLRSCITVRLPYLR